MYVLRRTNVEFLAVVDTLAIRERMDSVFAKSWTLSIREL